MKTMRWVVLGVAILAWSGMGCDSGSTDDPVDVTVEDDTTPGTDTRGEGDVTEEDLAVPEDTSTADTVECQNECALNDVQCSGATATMACTEDEDGCLVWGAQVACPAEQVCEAGVCKDAGGCEDECDTLGATECDGIATVKECVAGLDGCKDWKADSCDGEQTCENGACTGGGTTTPGVEGCLAINACMANCGGTDQACLQGCFTAGSAEGQAAYQGVAQCAQTNCAAVQANQAAYSLCILQDCKAPYEGCFGANWGTAGCMATLQCAGGCANQSCQQACFDDASYDGLISLMVMQACLGEKCATECAGTDQAACQTCATSKCATEVTACQNG